MIKLVRLRPGLVAAFVLACAVTLFFAGRLVFFTLYWSDPAHQNQAVEPWMTVGYIARSWHLEAQDLGALAGLPQIKGHPQSLAELAQARGVAIAVIIADVETAIAALRAKGGTQ